jgi:anaerobic nitric oxide reductase transcription regulator
MDPFETLISMAIDSTAALAAGDRYHRLLEALGNVIPYDAAALLRLDGDAMVPVATRGLSPDTMGRRFLLHAHPRLNIICHSEDPIHFSEGTQLPDPFDGLVSGRPGPAGRIHACLGCPLRVDGTLIGALTADAFKPDAFADLDQEFIVAASALAGAQMRTAHLLATLEQSAERQDMIASDLMRDIQMRQGVKLIGSSPVMVHLRREIDLVARSDFTVMVLGETGVGKELVVRAIHRASSRRNAPLFYLNCAALPETLADSELFGHIRGAFTGANNDRAGKFEVADGATLFLDEIGELPLDVQPKLLRAIQEGEIQRVGSNDTLRVDVRLLAATNRRLEEEVRSERFRVDLYHRLNVYPITVPPLRQRRGDIPLLAGYFCELSQRRLGLGPFRVNTEALEALETYHWPGNVRELENVLSRSILKAAAENPRGTPFVVDTRHIDTDISAPQIRYPQAESKAPPMDATVSMRQAVENLQRNLIRHAVAGNQGNWAAAARQLGMHRSNLHNLAKRLGLRRRSRL